MNAMHKQIYLTVFIVAGLLSWVLYVILEEKNGQLPTEDQASQVNSTDVRKNENNKIYRWVDQDGKVHFGDEKPNDVPELQASGEPEKEIKHTVVYRWTNKKGEVQFSDVRPETGESVQVTSYRQDQNVLPAQAKKPRIIGDELSEKQGIEKQVEQIKEKMDPANIQSQIPQLMKDTEILKESLDKRNQAIRELE